MLISCAVPAALLVFVLFAEKLWKKEAMGGGDIKLLLALALYLSWAQLLLALLAGCLLGIVGGLAGRNRGPMAFGPYLAAAAVGAACFGGPLIDWYLGLLI